jgi:hypothetical protein
LKDSRSLAGYGNQGKRQMYLWQPNQTIDLSLWAVGLMDTETELHRNVLRTFFLRCWRRRLYLEAMHWLRTAGRVTYSQNMEPLQDALERDMQANWWQIIDGSRLLF